MPINVSADLIRNLKERIHRNYEIADQVRNDEAGLIPI